MTGGAILNKSKGLFNVTFEQRHKGREGEIYVDIREDMSGTCKGSEVD